MITFRPWRKLYAVEDERIKLRFMKEVAEGAERYFKQQMTTAKHGRVYYKGHRRHVASAPNEFPANESGRLRASISSRYTAKRASVGSSMYYSKFLRDGTRFMERRKMSDDALKETVEKALPSLRGFIRFKYGR